jgi:hypothetical protein
VAVHNDAGVIDYKLSASDVVKAATVTAADAIMH